jgi:DNA polymerase III subunit gamma/tau
MAWYNKYRPQTFEEVIGQELIKKVFINAIKNNKIKHAYLLSGPKGVGKTTIARIFAKELNQTDKFPESKIDIIELDAASNTGIDNIRQLIETAQNPPISGKYKVYIIDEVHMLSKSAMNALLKILEEPPSYLVFILATTNPEKILPTVLSRLTCLNLTSHTLDDLVNRLNFIATQEGLKIDLASLKLIAKRAQGSQRDAINLLETVSSFGLSEYTEVDVANLLGMVSQEIFINLANSLLTNQLESSLLDTLTKQNLDAEDFFNQFLEFLIDQSFQQKTYFDALIIPVSEVLSLKLPTSSIISLVAILKAKLKFKDGFVPIFETNSSTQKNSFIHKPEKPEQPLETDSNSRLNSQNQIKTSQDLEKNNLKKTEKENKEKEIEQAVEISNQIEKNNLKNSSTKKTEKTISDTFKNLADLQAYLQEKLRQNPIFKIVIPDIFLEKLENGTLVLSVSTGIFLNQLKKGKLNTEIARVAEDFLKTSVKIEVVQRNSKLPKTESAKNLHQPEFSTNQEDYTFNDLQEITEELNNLEKSKKGDTLSPEEQDLKQEIEQVFDLKNLEDTETLKKTEKNTKPNKKGVFYKIYNKLPKDGPKLNLTVFKKEDFISPKKVIQKPDTQKTEKDWDKELETMFEFE